MSAPLIITQEVIEELKRLRRDAAVRPVNVARLKARFERGEDIADHRAQMSNQTLAIVTGPYAFFVTFSIETDHPCGEARHLSVSIERDGRVPSPAAVELIAHLLGFTGELSEWATYPEETRDGKAINVVQPTRVLAEARA